MCQTYRGGGMPHVRWNSSSNLNAPSFNQYPGAFLFNLICLYLQVIMALPLIKAYILGLAFAATTHSSYYVPGPTSDYTIKKKLESANQYPVTNEDKTVVLNATTTKSESDQVGAGSQIYSHEEAFYSPIMCITEEVLNPVSSKLKNVRKKCKKLTKICIK
jgi:hypothetical protein